VFFKTRLETASTSQCKDGDYYNSIPFVPLHLMGTKIHVVVAFATSGKPLILCYDALCYVDNVKREIIDRIRYVEDLLTYKLDVR
jgi:hypothetical protein